MSTRPTRPNRLLLAAGMLALFTALVHLLAGTPEVHAPLMSSSLERPVALLLLACWHLVSVALAASAAALLWSAHPRHAGQAGALARFVSLLWLLFGLVFMVVAGLYMGPAGLAALPQWMLLIPVGLLGCAGTRRGGTAVASAQAPGAS